MWTLVILLVLVLLLLAILLHRYLLIRKSITWQETEEVSRMQKESVDKELNPEDDLHITSQTDDHILKNDEIKNIKELFYKAEKSFQQSHFKRAENYLIQVLSVERDNKEASHLLAKIYLEGKNYSKAQALYENLTAKYKNPIYFTNLGLCYYVQGDLDNAIHAYLEALNIDPSRRERFLNLARVYEQLGDNAKVKEQYEKWLEREPKDIDALLVLAAHSEQEKNLVNAVAYYHKILSLSPYHEIAKTKVEELSQDSLGQ